VTLYRQTLLALRLLWREARSGELTLILLALILAVTATTAIALFSARLNLAMEANANDLLGADRRISSTTQLPDEWQTKAQNLDLKTARTMEFPSVVLHGDEMALAAIKAVDDGYPLRGRLAISPEMYGAGDPQLHGPQPGEAWAEARLLALLNVEVGDSVELGVSKLRISGVITEESDRGGNFYTLSPRLMVNWRDVENSSLLGPGSRINYRLLLAGSDDALNSLEQELVLEPNQKFESLDDGNQAMAGSLSRAKQYLGLSALLAVVLASVAVAICAQRYAQRHFDISALMRTFGLSQGQVLYIYTSQLFWIGTIATLVGAGLSLLLQAGLIEVLGDLLPDNLPAAPWSAWLLGLSSGLISLLGFALPHLMPLSRVSPLRVLRRDLVPVPLQGWFLAALALIALTFLLWLFTADVVLSLGMMGGGTLVVLLLLALLHLGIRLLRRRLQNIDLPLALRFAWQHLSRNSRQTAGQIIAFALTLIVMIVIGVVRNDLLADWQRSLPDDAPNVFAMNIQDYEREEFSFALDSAGLRAEPLYPMVPMRLVSINDVSVAELAIADDRAIDRDLISTTFNRLPDNNEIEEGDWSLMTSQTQQLSVEAKLAKRLGIELNDVIEFRASGLNFKATVSSLRTVDWGSMTPNFYMVFSADVLVSLPTSYLTSFYIPVEKQTALTQLIRQFPGVTLLDTRYLLGQIQMLLQRLTLAIELILAFVLVAAGLVTMAILISSTQERLREGAVLRTLGASSGRIRQAQMVEFSLLGGVAGLLALLGSEAICYGLYTALLDIPYGGLGWLWLWLLPATMLVLVALGTLLMRRAVTVAPLRVLRELD